MSLLWRVFVLIFACSLMGCIDTSPCSVSSAGCVTMIWCIKVCIFSVDSHEQHIQTHQQCLSLNPVPMWGSGWAYFAWSSIPMHFRVPDMQHYNNVAASHQSNWNALVSPCQVTRGASWQVWTKHMGIMTLTPSDRLRDQRKWDKLNFWGEIDHCLSHHVKNLSFRTMWSKMERLWDLHLGNEKRQSPEKDKYPECRRAAVKERSQFLGKDRWYLEMTGRKRGMEG